MVLLRFNLGKFLFFIQVIITLLLPKHMSRAAVTDNCTSAVYPTDACNKITYEQVYNFLAKSENSFNIESALYPPKRPSSVRVFVNVYGPNKTENSTPAAKYTWSISCLYAAVPAKVLQFWSLWSIMVTTRTQKLDITISLSCCDVTKGKLKKHIEDALAALQDLAVLPGLRDPQLNSAECITEGHQPNLFPSKEHRWRIMSMLGLSFLFSSLFGPLLAFYATQKRDELILEIEREEKTKKDEKKKRERSEIAKKNESQLQITKMTIDFLCGILLFIFWSLLGFQLGTFLTCTRDKEFVPIDLTQPVIIVILLIQPAIILVGIVVSIVTSYCYESVEKKSSFFIICSNFAAFHFCWLLIGMMLNPIWGLVVLLLVCLAIGVITFAFYTYKSSVASSNNKKENSTDSSNWNRCQSFFWCFAGCLAIYGLIAMVVFAGQSYSGRETENEALKEAVMYLITIFFAWLYWKKRGSERDNSSGPPLTGPPLTERPPQNGHNLEEDTQV